MYTVYKKTTKHVLCVMCLWSVLEHIALISFVTQRLKLLTSTVKSYTIKFTGKLYANLQVHKMAEGSRTKAKSRENIR